MSEAVLIQRAKQGDDGAWFMLMRTHQEAVFRLAYLLVGNATDAEDVAQEVFLRAFAALPHFAVDRPLRPWLLTITRNLSANWRRALRRYLAALGRWEADQPAAQTASSDDRFAANWSADQLWRAVQRLSRADQEVIYVRYFLELSVEESASVLGVAAGTVKSRLARALVRLRIVIERDFPELVLEVAE